jgi:hypothetical protein
MQKKQNERKLFLLPKPCFPALKSPRFTMYARLRHALIQPMLESSPPAPRPLSWNETTPDPMINLAPCVTWARVAWGVVTRILHTQVSTGGGAVFATVMGWDSTSSNTIEGCVRAYTPHDANFSNSMLLSTGWEDYYITSWGMHVTLTLPCCSYLLFIPFINPFC